MDINRNGNIEFFELIDFIVGKFGEEKDVTKVLLNMIGVSLDQ